MNKLETGSKEKTYRLGITEGWISGVGNIILFGLKIWAGLVSGSVALIADAWHSLTDTLTSLIVLIGIKIAGKPADKEHPYGHGRAEVIASLIIGILLILVAIHFVTESVEKLKCREDANFGIIAISVMILSLIVKEGMAQFAFWIARKTKAESIRADGWHHRSDAISSVIILLGIFVEKFAWWIDGALGILVSFVIFYSAWLILKNTVSILLGQKPNIEMINEIKTLVEKIYPGKLRIHHFHIHNYGFHNEMTFHIVLPENMRLHEARKITQKIFEEIKSQMNILATIHIDTESKY
jgi:cation diffusion facilitator family transporter